VSPRRRGKRVGGYEERRYEAKDNLDRERPRRADAGHDGGGPVVLQQQQRLAELERIGETADPEQPVGGPHAGGADHDGGHQQDHPVGGGDA